MYFFNDLYHNDYSIATLENLSDTDHIYMNVYSLGFLKTAENIQTNGVLLYFFYSLQ